jgi:hypothetical protein
MRVFFITVLSFCFVESFSQDSTSAINGNERFTYFDTLIKWQCGVEGYRSQKLKKRKINNELEIVRVINDVVLKKITIDSSLVILKNKAQNIYYDTFEKNGFIVKKILVNNEYIKYSLIDAAKKEGNENYVGAVLASTYDLYCKNFPNGKEIYGINIDINFFGKIVLKKIKCRYQITNNLALGDSGYIFDTIRVIFW